MKKYPRIWLQLLKNSFASTLSNRIDSASYFIGKLIRFAFFWLLIVSIFRITETFAGYDKYQVLFFFLTFNLVDLIGQIFFRGIYLFSSEVRKGSFDFSLVKPVSSLFLAMSRLIDLLDIICLVPILGLMAYTLLHLPITITVTGLSLYGFFIILASGITLSFHVIIAAATIWSFENEHFIWLYRETMTLGRLPPDILPATLQLVLTYIVPIVIMVAYPVNGLFGIIHTKEVLMAIGITTTFLCLSLIIWNRALRTYSSASS